MPKPRCALCFATIDSPGDGIITGHKCAHSFHAWCIKAKLGLETSTEAAGELRAFCPTCELTGNNDERLKVLKAINEGLGSLDGTVAKVESLIADIEGLHRNMNKLAIENATFRQDLQNVKGTIDTLKTEVSDLVSVKVAQGERLTALEEKVPAGASGVISHADEAVLLRAACDQLANHLIVFGVPETPDNEDLKLFVIKLSLALDNQISIADVKKVKRMGKKITKKGTSVAGSGSQRVSGRAILLILESADKCDRVLTAKKLKPELKASDIDKNMPNGKIYIRRRQPIQLHRLRDKILKRFPELEPKYLWIANGAVFARRDQSAKPVRILPSTDMSKLSSSLFGIIANVIVSPEPCALPIVKACCINVQSLTAHFQEFREYFRINFYHIIAVTETWLNEDSVGKEVTLPSYTLLRVDREGRRGGGVAVYLRKELHGQIVASSASPENKYGIPEFLIVEIWAPSRPKILVAVVYRPPKSGYLNLFENALTTFLPNYKFVCVFGDFNADLMSDTYDSKYLRKSMAAMGLTVVRFKPTHHTSTSNTWLDICAVSDLAALSKWGQSAQPFLSGHDLIYAYIKYASPRRDSRDIRHRFRKNVNLDDAGKLQPTA